MKCDDATRYLSWAAYAGLAVAVGVSLYNGPVTKYQRKETSLVTGEIEVDSKSFCLSRNFLRSNVSKNDKKRRLLNIIDFQ